MQIFVNQVLLLFYSVQLSPLNQHNKYYKIKTVGLNN
jgi:hypothetical protein